MQREESQSVLSLQFTLNPHDAQWGVSAEPIAGGALALIGWVVDRAAVDSGVPEQVVDVLSRALTQNHAVTFLDGNVRAQASAWQPTPEGWVRELKSNSLLRRATFPLMCSTRHNVVRRLFDADGFDWTQQAQVGIISASAAPPDLTYPCLRELLDYKRARREDWNAADGFLLPGVDGDFAALALFDPASWSAFERAIALQCARAGIGWQGLSESEFCGVRWIAEREPMR